MLTRLQAGLESERQARAAGEALRERDQKMLAAAEQTRDAAREQLDEAGRQLAKAEARQAEAIKRVQA